MTLKDQIANLLANDDGGAAPAQQPSGAPASQPAGDLSATIAQAVASGVAQAMAAQQGQPSPQPSSFAQAMQQRATKPPPFNPGQPPPATVFTEDTPLWELSTEDRAHLVKTKGASWYRSTMRKQAKSVLIRR